MPTKGAKAMDAPTDPENSMLMRAHMNQYGAHMNQYVAAPEEISDTFILGRGTVITFTTLAKFRLSLPSSAFLWARRARVRPARFPRPRTA